MSQRASLQLVRLVVVEDNEDDYLLLRAHFVSAGWQVVAVRVETAAELRTALAQQRPDAVISDHQLPEFDSLRALEIAREFDPDIPFILFSGAIGEEGAVVAMQAGADDYVMKDKPGRLAHGLHRALEVAATRRRQREAEEVLRRTQGELRELAAHLTHVREEEREAIARDIHDDVGSNLLAVKLQVALLKGQLREDAAMIGQLDALGAMVDTAILSSSRIMHDLRPGILDAGIVAALEWQAREFQNRVGLPCGFTASAESIAADRATSITLFRICQEALSNVAKYAAAGRADVRLEEVAGRLRLIVRDDGAGIHPHDMAKPGCFGLRGMTERAASLGGAVVITGVPQRGTEVAVTLPLVAARRVGNGDDR